MATKLNPLSRDLGNALLARHKQICHGFAGKPEDLISDAVISYKALLGVIGAPETLAKSIGGYLNKLAVWSREKNLPPINSLAVNGASGTPGAGYYIAPGCGDWDQEIRDCIACKNYPAII